MPCSTIFDYWQSFKKKPTLQIILGLTGITVCIYYLSSGGKAMQTYLSENEHFCLITRIREQCEPGSFSRLGCWPVTSIGYNYVDATFCYTKTQLSEKEKKNCFKIEYNFLESRWMIYIKVMSFKSSTGNVILERAKGVKVSVLHF